MLLGTKLLPGVAADTTRHRDGFKKFFYRHYFSIALVKTSPYCRRHYRYHSRKIFLQKLILCYVSIFVVVQALKVTRYTKNKLIHFSTRRAQASFLETNGPPWPGLRLSQR